MQPTRKSVEWIIQIDFQILPRTQTSKTQPQIPENLSNVCSDAEGTDAFILEVRIFPVSLGVFSDDSPFCFFVHPAGAQMLKSASKRWSDADTLSRLRYIDLIIIIRKLSAQYQDQESNQIIPRSLINPADKAWADQESCTSFVSTRLQA